MSDGPATPKTNRPWRRTLFWIVAAAFVLRAVGSFGQGLPHAYYGDETNAVQRALYFGAMGTADPGWFSKPALNSYLLFAAYGAVYVGGKIGGAWSSTAEFGAFATENYAPFILTGRLLSALFGAATCWLVYLIGKRLRDRATGLVAALVLALVPGHLVSCRLVKEEAATVFFMTAATLALLDVVVRARLRDYVRAGGLAGVAMAIKYYAPALAIPGAFAHLFRGPEARVGRGRLRGSLHAATACLVFMAAFFVGSPYNFLNPNYRQSQVEPALARVLGQLGIQVRFGATSAPSAGASAVKESSGEAAVPADLDPQAHRSPFAPYGRMTDTGGKKSLFDRVAYGLKSFTVGTKDEAGDRAGALCTTLSVLSVVGLGLALSRRTRRDMVLIVAVFGSILFVSAAGRQMPEPRHLLVAAPFAAFWVADACVFIALFVRRRFDATASPSWIGGAIVLAVASIVPTGDPVSLGGSFVGAQVDMQREASVVDARTLAIEFCEARIPAGSTLINMHEALPLRVGAERARHTRDRIRGLTRGDPRNHHRGHGPLWELRIVAASRPGRPTFDALVIESPWQGEDSSAEGRARARAGFAEYRPDRPATRPAETPPVERYRRIPWTGDPAADAALARDWEAARDLVPGTRADWLAAAETTYDNYEKPSKRDAWPEFAAFFDDLKRHYAAYQWSTGPTRSGVTIRVYDLRRRFEGGAPPPQEMPR